jgi:hypothetical protein
MIFDAERWKNVQAYDCATLSQNERSLLRRAVGIRFHFRSAKLRPLLGGDWYEAVLFQKDPGTKRIAFARVMVAKKDVPAFETITSDPSSMTETTVYAYVDMDDDNTRVEARLVGRKVAIHPSGYVTVDW